MPGQCRVGFLHLDSRSAEQSAAYDWCRDTAGRVEAVDLLGVANGSVDLGAYDVLWWHRGEPAPADGRVAHWRAPIESYVRDGGALLLTLRAMSSVTGLGFDAVAPDATGIEGLPEPTGLLAKRRHASHPLFDSVHGLRAYTLPDGVTQPYARYESVVPQRGDLLASTVRGDEDVPHEMPAFAWTPGDGAVVGIGAAATFGEVLSGPFAETRDALLGGVLSYLGGDRPAGVPSRPREADGLRAARRDLSADPHFPRYHVSPPGNWLNDPNGLIERDGTYHLFYQYNPVAPFHGVIHWGHATSDDLVTWADRPVALEPSPDGPDRDGCWSGCAVVEDDTPTLVYTGGRGREQLPCLATAADEDLTTWEKSPDNPVIEAPPPEFAAVESDHWAAEFRDHCVWRADGRWKHLIGSGEEGVGGAVLLYEGDTLQEWEYVGPVLVGDWPGAGDVWECPELLDFGEKQLLHVSNYDDVLCFVGEFEDGRFDVDWRGHLDYGDYYAPQSLFESDGRYLTWGWLPEARGVRSQWEAGWSGALSVPRRITVTDDGALTQRPAEELRGLRVGDGTGVSRSLADESVRLDVAGRSLELQVDVQFGDAETAGLRVLESPSGTEATPVAVHRDGRLVVDRPQSTLAEGVDDAPQEMPLGEWGADPQEAAARADGGDGDTVSLRVFVDGSVVEVFANERRCLTSRVYPTRQNSTGVSLFATGGDADLEVTAWELGDGWRT